MDYDDNEFQSQNLHLAGEGNTKFPPVLHPYALPKFDFDDSLHGQLRFDSLVETEVFLGIESNEDNQWIEDFSQGSSGIQFSSSATQACSISRHNNVWSEAASSESVEMLLKSVGQEEIVPVQSNTKESDGCDELGHVIKQMESTSKQEKNFIAETRDFTDSQPKPTLSQGGSQENFPELVTDVAGHLQHPAVENSTDTVDESADTDLGDLSGINVEVGLPVTEGSPFVDGKSSDVNQKEGDTSANKSLDNRIEKSVQSGMQGHNVVTSMQIITCNDKFNNEYSLNQMNEIAEGNAKVLETDNEEHQVERRLLSKEGQINDQILDSNVVKSDALRLENTLCSPSVASVEEVNVSNAKEDSCMASKGDYGISGDLQIAEQLNYSFERHQVEDHNVSQLDDKNLVSNPRASSLSVEDNKGPEYTGYGHRNTLVVCTSNVTAVCSSAEFHHEAHADGNVSSSIPVELIEKCEKMMVPDQGVDGHNTPIEKKENRNLPPVSTNMDNEVVASHTIDRGGALFYGEVSMENELIVSNPQSDTGNKSGDAIPGPSGNGATTDAFNHKEMPTLPAAESILSDKEGEVANKISIEGNSLELKASCEVATELDLVSELKKGSSPDAIGVTDQSLSIIDPCNKENESEPQTAPINKVTQECTKEMEVSPVLFDSTPCEQHGAEAVVREDDRKSSSNFSAMGSSCEYISQKGQEEKNAIIACGETSNQQIAVPSANVECVQRVDLDKSASGNPTVIRTAVSLKEVVKERVGGSPDQSVLEATKVFSDPSDPKQRPKPNDASKDENNFTFEVNPLADLPQKEVGQKWQPFSSAQISKVSPIVDGPPSTSGTGQLDPNITHDLSHGSTKVVGVANVRSSSKGNTERKTRRASGKSATKEAVKKGNPGKETTPVRIERADKITNVSMTPSGISQPVRSNEMQHHGHVDSSSTKPFVLATPTSTLPDLNSSVSASAVFQQPFTDQQQVQLRAQIFVYGALIQGTAPDDTHMVSAFGGPDGGKSIWENAWRSCIERLHGQKSHPVTPETPLQSRSGARASDQAIKQSALQNKAVSSSVGRASSKGAPTIINPIVPLSSPLWSMPNPTGDNLQSSAMPRGPVMDYQRAISPLHAQTPPLRNFVGHTPWISQAPFVPWIASPQTSAFDANGRFSVQLPITEPVQLTPVKELSLPHSSSAKLVSAGPVVQSGASTGVYTGISPVPDTKKDTTLSAQPSANPKSRKRKKALASENSAPNILHPQPQTDSVPSPAVATHLSTSSAIITPLPYVSIAPTERLIASVSPPSSTDIRKGVQNAEKRAVSEETLGKVKDARLQAEEAAALAAVAVSHSEDIWNQLDKQRSSGLLSDVETKLASAAVAIAAAAAVAKAAAAAANVASNAALQAKLMAEEAVVSGAYTNSGQTNLISLSEGMTSLTKATPVSILKGDNGTDGSSSILVAAREAARRRVEAASAASKQAENMDAIVKAAELAAEAVSQAGKIVAMGEPLPLSELIAAGRDYWKAAQVTSGKASKSNAGGREILNIEAIEEGRGASAKHKKVGTSDKKGTQIRSHEKSPNLKENSSDVRLVDGFSGPGVSITKDAKGQKVRKASDLAKTIGVVPESENGPRLSVDVQNEQDKAADALEENSIKEGTPVEVFKDGSGYKAAWFSANVVSLKDGNAYVSFNELTLGEGPEKLKEWVALKGEEDEAPKIRVARPFIAMPFEGTRKRRRAAMGDYAWSVGDRVDAWMQDSWWEGIITEKSKKDETMLTVHFPVQGETSVARAWHLRPSLTWKDGEWMEWASSRENIHTSYVGDTPKEKRARVKSPVGDAKGKDKTSKDLDDVEFVKPHEPTLLELSANEKMFNVGKSSRNGNKPDMLRMTRTGLQKEGSRVIFGVPKPGKKRKFMDVSKHFADKERKTIEPNDSVKFAKFLIPQGSGPRGWKNTSKSESNEKQAAMSRPKVQKSGKPTSTSGRSIPQKDKLLRPAASAPEDGAVADDISKMKDSATHAGNTSGKQNLNDSQSFSSCEGPAEGPIVLPALALPSDTASSRKVSTSNPKPERVSKGKLAPAVGKLSKIEEDKVLNANSVKSNSDVEPRRSNRRIQPTSRLLEGLQSSLMVSKIPSASDRSQKSRSAARGGNNHG